MLLRFDNVSVRDERNVLFAGLDFKLKNGESAAIVGPSKSGKSALLLLAAGHGLPHLGAVGLEGTEGLKQHQVIGLGPIQGFSPLFETLTVEEHLLFQARLYKIRGARRRRDELIQQYALQEVRKQRVKDLTQFDAFRVSLAVTVMHRPQFVLLDEPERGLSSDEWELATAYLQQLTSSGSGVLFTTVLESACNWTDFVIQLPVGEVIQQCPSLLL